MYWPGREPGDAPAAPQLRLMLSRSCCCSACMRIGLFSTAIIHQITQLLSEALMSASPCPQAILRGPALPESCQHFSDTLLKRAAQCIRRRQCSSC